MGSLTNRLRVSWLTMAALVASVVVALIGPDGVSQVQVQFAHGADQFKTALLAHGASALAIETVDLVRAQLTADMMFLVAYGLLLRASVLLLPSTPFRRLAAHAAVLTMIADGTENIFALAVLRTFGEQPDPHPPSWWFVAMNAASATKWLVAGAVMLCLAAGWRRRADSLAGWRRWAGWTIAAAFAIGGAASARVGIGVRFAVEEWLTYVALIGPAIGLLIQFRLLDTSALMVRFLYLARVPFVVLFAMAIFGPIALGPAVALLGGILVAGKVVAVAVTTSAAIALLFACTTQINIVRAYAWQRVLDDSLRVLDHETLASTVFWTGVVAAASVIFSVGVVSSSLTWHIPAGVVLGMGASFALLYVIEWIAARLSYSPPGYPLRELGVPFRRVRRLANWLNAATNAPPPAFKRHFVGWFVSRLFGTRSGYVEPLPNGQRRILPEHTFAAIQFVLTVLVFGLALYAKALPTEDAGVSVARIEEIYAPTVTSILLLLLLTGWALAAVAFFFDRYRTPLFTIAVAAAFVTGSRACTDYTVSVARKGPTYDLATPGQVLTAFGPHPLVVAAAGGGIQAGAWTARVLKGLDDHLHGTLRRRVAMISSVSGGSMGALYYGAYDAEPNLDRIVRESLKPSLDDVATSFVGRDIFGVIGLRFGRDRGAALEDSWKRRLPKAQRKATLTEWSTKSRDFALGRNGQTPFPAFLFNSTIVESGQPVAFATTRFPTHDYRLRFDAAARQYPAVESANRIFRLATLDDGPAADIGLKVVTAARLSAAFPYVSPAATLVVPGAEPFHLVDGGYYDVYGLVALSQWLDDALEEICPDNREIPLQIGVVIARGLASSDSPLIRRLRGADASTPALDPPLDRAITPRGWRWQLTAPPSTALHARDFAQWAGGVQLLTTLIDKWATRNVRIVPYVFDYPGTDDTPECQSAPLSWKLTTQQQCCIDKAWKTFAQSSTLQKLE